MVRVEFKLTWRVDLQVIYFVFDFVAHKVRNAPVGLPLVDVLSVYRTFLRYYLFLFKALCIEDLVIVCDHDLRVRKVF